MRYAIITPYYRETRTLLERCIFSVRNQTLGAVDHIMVADGHPQDWIDDTGVRHLRLDRAHDDYGNTPRGMGVMLAVAERYDGIGLLDADNWLDPGHVALCTATFLAASKSNQIDYVIAQRRLCRPDQSILPISDGDPVGHVDTSCFFFFPGSYHILPHLGIMPKALSPIGDRIIRQVLPARGLRHAICPEVTVNYHCLWQSIYLAAGETPPPDAKPRINSGAVQAWFDALSAEDKHLTMRRAGLVP